MSTHAAVVIRDKRGDSQWFYRHSDGYPDGVKPTLDQFVEWVRNGRIRDNVSQSSGWLVLLGRHEYGASDLEPGEPASYSAWKAGAYEPDGKALLGGVSHVYEVMLDGRKTAWREVAPGEYERWRESMLKHGGGRPEAQVILDELGPVPPGVDMVALAHSAAGIPPAVPQ